MDRGRLALACGAPQPTQQLAHRLLGNAQSTRDLAIGGALLLPEVDHVGPFRWQPCAALGEAARVSDLGHGRSLANPKRSKNSNLEQPRRTKH